MVAFLAILTVAWADIMGKVGSEGGVRWDEMREQVLLG